MAAVAGPAEQRVREAFGGGWEFGTEGNELTATERGGSAVLSARSWEVLGALLAGVQRDRLRAEVTGRRP